jgi:hypothetical protein
VFGTLVIEPEVSGQNNWTKVSPIPWYQMVLQTTFACLLQFAMRESVRSFYSTCTHVSAFLSSLVEEVSEIAGPVIQCSAKRSRSAREPGKEK